MEDDHTTADPVVTGTGELPEQATEESTVAPGRRSRRAVRSPGSPTALTPVAISVPAATAPTPTTGAPGAEGAITTGSGTGHSGRKATAPAGPPRHVDPEPPAPDATADDLRSAPEGFAPETSAAEPPAAVSGADTDENPTGETADDRTAAPAEHADTTQVSDARAEDQRTEDGTAGGVTGPDAAAPSADTAGAGEPDVVESTDATGPCAEVESAASETSLATVPQADTEPATEAGPAESDATAGAGPADGLEPGAGAHADPADAGETSDTVDPDASTDVSPPRSSRFSLLFQQPDAEPAPRRRAASRPAGPPPIAAGAPAPVTFASPDEATPEPVPVREEPEPEETPDTTVDRADREVEDTDDEATGPDQDGQADDGDEDRGAGGDDSPRRRRRRGGRGRRRRADDGDDQSTEPNAEDDSKDSDEPAQEPEAGADRPAEEDGGTGSRRRRRRRRSGSEDSGNDDTPVRSRRSRDDEVTGVKGSTRLEAKRQRRREGRESGRRRHVLTEAEFLARREAVARTLLVRERDGLTQIVVLEDDVLVEHHVARKTATSMIGNVYLGRVQNVLPSMEAAFVDIGKGRNAVLYAGEVNWDAAGLQGQPRRIELALKSGDPVLVQVSKDPVGHKGARLTSQISLPGRYLVYVPNSTITGISRKLPDTERARLKKVLRAVVPEDAGVIVRTAAEGASEVELERDVARLQTRWEQLSKRSGAVSPPTLLHSEPDLTIKVIRDVFNEDFKELIVSGAGAAEQVVEYVDSVAPDLADRVTVWDSEEDLFAKHRVDEQIAKALERKVWLPSGGSLVIDRTEAMTVIDVNTGRFVGSGGNLEETVTRNNLEAAEEIVRQLRLRDVGGIIVIDFIDMVLEANRDLVLRRLVECLGRDRTKHQVAEVTSLGLVQMTRKRMGQGLLEAFSAPCESCGGRGVHLHDLPAAPAKDESKGGGSDEPKRHFEASRVAQAARKAKERETQAKRGPEKGSGQATPTAERDVAEEIEPTGSQTDGSGSEASDLAGSGSGRSRGNRTKADGPQTGADDRPQVEDPEQPAGAEHLVEVEPQPGPDPDHEPEATVSQSDSSQPESSQPESSQPASSQPEDSQPAIARSERAEDESPVMAAIGGPDPEAVPTSVAPQDAGALAGPDPRLPDNDVPDSNAAARAQTEPAGAEVPTDER